MTIGHVWPLCSSTQTRRIWSPLTDLSYDLIGHLMLALSSHELQCTPISGSTVLSVYPCIFSLRIHGRSERQTFIQYIRQTGEGQYVWYMSSQTCMLATWRVRANCPPTVHANIQRFWIIKMLKSYRKQVNTTVKWRKLIFSYHSLLAFYLMTGEAQPPLMAHHWC